MGQFVEQLAVERPVVELAVERPVVELAVPVPALDEDEDVPAVAVSAPLRTVAPVAGLVSVAVEPARVPPSLRRDLPVPLTSSARQAARRLISSRRVWRTCVPR